MGSAAKLTETEQAERAVRRAVRNPFAYPSVRARHLVRVLAEYDRRGEELTQLRAELDNEAAAWRAERAETERLRGVAQS
jgi:hypothetical protein